MGGGLIGGFTVCVRTQELTIKSLTYRIPAISPHQDGRDLLLSLDGTSQVALGAQDDRLASGQANRCRHGANPIFGGVFGVDLGDCLVFRRTVGLLRLGRGWIRYLDRYLVNSRQCTDNT